MNKTCEYYKCCGMLNFLGNIIEGGDKTKYFKKIVETRCNGDYESCYLYQLKKENEELKERLDYENGSDDPEDTIKSMKKYGKGDK